MNDLDRHLAESLRNYAAELNVPGGDVGRVVTRTRIRRRRHAFSAISVVAVVALAVTAIVAGRLGDHRRVTVAASGTSAGGGALLRGDIGVVWQRVDPHSALGTTTASAAGGALYAISTPPGVTDPPSPYPGRQLYRSTDGVEWTPAGGPPNAYLSDLSATGQQLYAVGTGAATVNATGALTPLIVGSSADSGATWRQIQLPIDVGAIQAGTLANHSETIKVASNSKGVLVVAQVAGDLDVPKFLPPGVTAPDGWVVTDAGVDLLGPINNPACPAGMTATPPGIKGVPTTMAPRPPTAAGAVGTTTCWSKSDTVAAAAPDTIVPPEANHPVTRTFTWAQLGIAGDLQQAAKGEPFVYFSTDGKTFRPVPLPNLPTHTTSVQVASDANTFAIAATSTATSTATKNGSAHELLWQSADGTSWAATPTPPADQIDPHAVGFLAGRLTLVSGFLATSPTVATLATGSWSEAPLTGVLDTAPAGTTFDVYAAAIGPFGVAVAVAQISAANAPPPTFQPEGPASTPNPLNLTLLASRDGITWSNEPLSQLANSTVTEVPNIVVTANRFIITAQLHASTTTPPVPERVIVGTAR